MRKDLILLGRIFALSVIVYQLNQVKTKPDHQAADAASHAGTRHALADEVPEKLKA